MRGHNLGWKAFCDSNPEWSCLKLITDSFRKSLAAQLGNSAGQFLVKSVVFFISHVRVGHQSLLFLYLINYTVPAAHSVKNLYRAITDGIIEHFNRVTRPVETNKTVFVAVSFQQTIVDSSPVGMDNVIPRYPMLERRRHKYNFRLHAFSIAQNRAINNKISAMVSGMNF